MSLPHLVTGARSRLRPELVTPEAVVAHGGRAAEDDGAGADALVAVVQVALAEEGVALGALAPAPTIAIGDTAEAAVAAVHRSRPPLEVGKQVGPLLLADGAAADLVAVREPIAVGITKRPPAVLADRDRGQVTPREDSADLAGMQHPAPPHGRLLTRAILYPRAQAVAHGRRSPRRRPAGRHCHSPLDTGLRTPMNGPARHSRDQRPA